jgi:adenosylcobinamide-GDP ribazoletransferase
MNSFLIALQFLTIIPVNYSFIASDKQLGFSACFYPLVGLIMGSLLVLSSLVLGLSNLSIPVQAALILMGWVVLTGGLHLDGLADCADAWVGGLGSQQRSLEIMKDPAAGPIAVIVLVLLLLLKWLAISLILENQRSEILLLAPMLGRVAILLLMLLMPYVRIGGLGCKIVYNLPIVAIKGLSFFCILCGVYFLGSLPVGFMGGMLLMIGYHSNKRLGGVTGDVYGASVELIEIVILLGCFI